ncbi:MAG: glycoside hydrolase family 43 protein [Faecalibacterium sp.]|nr:glycoside hydrolase family 43 protein [Ruminococcus sp.]MCM1391218.1 glycoside hydrolase family 43 protein [Ruminococcus sp.]MCM1485654.1 glycoside hydrolase family 43 protein [Faecalibacterium sp.]
MKLNEIVNLRDPFILPDNGKYYLYGTRGWGDGLSKQRPGLGFDVYISDDLENWSEPVEVFSKTEDFWGETNFWAPEVHRYKDKYYLLASFKSESRHRGTQIFVSNSPTGRFKAISEKPVTPSNWECLDGTLYIDKNNKPHMIFCHEWTQVKNGEMCSIELSDDLSHPISEPKLLFKAADPDWANKMQSTHVTDGPFMYRTKGGRLLMIWSSSINGNYCAAVSFSSNGEINGEWLHEKELLFSKDGGHGMIFKGFNGKLYFVCHQPNEREKEKPVLFCLTESNDRIKLLGHVCFE